VVEGEVKALEFAEALLASIENMRAESGLPASVSRNSTAIANREYYFFHLEAEGHGKVLTSKTMGSTVIYSDSPPTLKDLQFCSGQMVMVCRMAELESVYSALMNHDLRTYCQVLAFYGKGEEFLDRLTFAGISHVTKPGHLNDKEVGFSHDGLFNLQELTRLVTRSRTCI
jgi:hypothetical protein